MFLQYVPGLFVDPRRTWVRLRDKDYTVMQCLLGHTLLFALIPTVSGYLGVTQVGWQVGTSPVVKLTPESALTIASSYYLAMIAAVFAVGWMIRWMSTTYGAHQPLSRCMVLASYTASPLFLIGFMLLYPVLWLNLVLGLPALAYTIHIFYTGVPKMMEISAERGFLFATAMLAFGLVTLVAMLAVTVLLWNIGFAPSFTN